MFKQIKNSKPALIGLIILFAVSLVMAGGRKPPEMYPKITGKYLEKGAEVDEVVRIVCSGKDEGLQNAMKADRRWLKVNDQPLLNSIFPGVKIYKWSDYREGIELLIVSNGKPYTLNQFNQLLLDNGLEVTKKNIVKLTKAFVILASGEEYGRFFLGKILGSDALTQPEGQRSDEQFGFPQITFLEVKKSKRTINKEVIYWTNLKVHVNDQTQIYGCRFEKGQLQWATMNIEGGTATKYFDFKIIKNLPER